MMIHMEVKTEAVQRQEWEAILRPDAAGLRALRQQALEGDMNALLAFVRHIEDPQERRPWLRLHHKRRLEQMRRRGIETVRLSAGSKSIRRACPACLERHGRIISTDASAFEVIPPDCSCNWPALTVLST